MDESRDAIESVVLESLRLGKSSSLVVAGTSMEPWIRRGDRVWLEPIAGAGRPVALGDVVLVADTRIRQLHRVIALAPGRTTVKGDACDAGAWEVPLSMVIARAESIERGGRRLYLHPRVGRVIATASPYSRYYQRVLMLGVRILRRLFLHP